MKREGGCELKGGIGRGALLLALVAAAVCVVRYPVSKAAETPLEEQLSVHRNLGKAFYENPTMHAQAVEEFNNAPDLAPDSTRERLHYRLALLRDAQTKAGIAELEKVHEQEPQLPHT